MAQDLNQISPIEINVKDLWLLVLKKLNNELGNEIFNSWIKNIKVQSIDDDILYFSVPTRFIRDWITSHYLDKIIFFLNAENPNIRRVKISIDNMLSANQNNQDEKIQKLLNIRVNRLILINLMIGHWMNDLHLINLSLVLQMN